MILAANLAQAKPQRDTQAVSPQVLLLGLLQGFQSHRASVYELGDWSDVCRFLFRCSDPEASAHQQAAYLNL